MMKVQSPAKRAGFTLVEVALAVAVGLIVIGGAILAFNAVKENAANSNAQSRVLAGVTVVEEYSGNNSGTYPVSATGGTFTSLWSSKQGDAADDNPWGGVTGAASGAIEVTAGNFGSATESAAGALTETTAALTSGLTNGAAAGQSAALLYVSGTTAATPWAGVRQSSTMTTVGVKNYAVGICDKNGVPWWTAKGGK
ncbi:MAG: prepilin-type N-terminal cleavage/methylation domain-containing protein [Candidatus Sericytochromatia bacterium]|nr:prepilin-type N-terminal cleavage/methylation domain-containing protein [Candidatus Sericytochromatia bacterium]